jgi:hypothetical protein
MSKAAFSLFAEACRLLAAGFDALGQASNDNAGGDRPKVEPRRRALRPAPVPDQPPTDIDRQKAREALRKCGVPVVGA